MFSGFDAFTVDVGETAVFIRRKGSGPPVLLLHGFPQTHLMWHRVAPALAEEFTVVCADLRGYGASGKPPSRPDHMPYAKRAMALDIVRMMESQGFTHFSVAGHDRGARVAYRMALDHPDRIKRLLSWMRSPPARHFVGPTPGSRWPSGPGRCLLNPNRCPSGCSQGIRRPSWMLRSADGVRARPAFRLRSEPPTSQPYETRRPRTPSVKSTARPPRSTLQWMQRIGGQVAGSRARP
jgi:pimeloyl-ACP methyl ester carboxylesterase